MRDGWVETTLDSVTECSWGNTEITKSKYVESGFLAYSASGADGFLDWFEHDRSAIVLSAIGAQCGKTWFAEGQWTSIKNTIWLKSDKVNLLDKYLFYLSNRDQFWQIRGQAQPFISLGDVKKTKVLLPPLSEQKRIVDLISSVDSYIEALQNQLESATRSRNAILHELLTVGGDDWVETPIGDVAEVLSGFAFKSNLFNKSEGIPLIRIRDLPKRNSTEALYSGSYEDRYIVKKGDFLIGMDGEFHCYEWNGPDALLNQRVCRIQDFKIGKVVPRYIYFAVNQYLDKIEQDTGYTTVKHISAKQVLGIKIPLPPLLEQKRIVGIISEMDDFIESIQRTLVKAKSLRSGLLSDLLIGAHEIPVGYDKVMDAAR